MNTIMRFADVFWMANFAALGMENFCGGCFVDG